jgi:hypothetical protein
MAAFWQDCEVAKPNKLVPVPRKLLFSSFRKTKSGKHTDICLQTLISQETASSGSGSHRSQEEGTEKQLLGKNPSTTSMRCTNTVAKDKPDGGDCGSYLDARFNIDIEEIAAAVASAAAVVV